MRASPSRLLESPKRAGAALLAVVVDLLVEEAPPPLPPPGAVGTNVAPALEMHELAAALAAETEDGAAGLTVPLPAKEHACGSRLLAS
jgi:hypothetical protein